MARGIDHISRLQEKNKKDFFKNFRKSNQCPLTFKFLRYISYLSEENNATNPLDIINFLEKNPSWPQKKKLRDRIEKLTPVFAKKYCKKIPIKLVKWFLKFPPNHGDALLIYARGLKQHYKDEALLKKIIKEAWHKGRFSQKSERKFYNLYNSFLTEKDHWERANLALWDKKHSVARRMLPKLSKKHKLLVQTRLYLQEKKGNIKKHVENCKKHFKNYSGFLYDHLVWHREKRKNDMAFSLCKNIPIQKVKSKLFWREKHILARRALEEKNYQRAYELVSNHGLSYSSDFANAEFLSGWIALRYLNKPKIAEKKFRALYLKVSTPISKSRMAYWLGRAYEAQKKPQEAKIYYKKAALFKTTFYGQRASEKLGLPKSIYLFKKNITDKKTKKITGNKTFAILIKMFSKVPSSYKWQKSIVLNFANQAKSMPEKIHTLELITKYTPHFSSDAARVMNMKGEVFIKEAFPAMYRKHINDNIEPSIAWAIMRRESGFNYKAVSTAGALGLMQLMPKTAKQIAKEHKIKFCRANSLLEKPPLNVQIGTALLKKLLSYYNGVYPFAIAAYNAGEKNVDEWIRVFGNPNKEEIDWLDWLESIPFYETRNYIQRVLEHLHIYRINYGDETIPHPLVVQKTK